MIEDDCTIGPAVMVYQTEVRKEANPDCLEPTLVTQSEGIAVDLKRKYRDEVLQGMGARSFYYYINILYYRWTMKVCLPHQRYVRRSLCYTACRCLASTPGSCQHLL